ncbi:MotA/TolQ/ExbB proton channel family protein [Brevundimonas sp.]|uniref:MotA/TolQ/ExbB proton channel family protein n=1 Tax=Brevundimonas sp. TaxID=1871086 RepID=UPI0025DB18A8|nr:MotA/TolQ/ExbB proton channel family protein [Brevundimonas sp.]
MSEMKKSNLLLAFVGAFALMTAAPALAATPATTPPTGEATAEAPAEGAAATTEAPAEVAAPAEDADAVTEIEHAGELTIVQMFLDADWVVKTVMIGLILASIFSWTLLLIKLFEFGSLNRNSDRFLEAFRSARSIADMRRIATSDEFEGNPMADMAAAATEEVELSRQAGLGASHNDSTMMRAQAAVAAVQAGLAKRLSGGQQFLASVGSGGPFIGLFGTVYGIMRSFIGIANTNTTNLAVVAPGIAEALLATGIGLFAAIPAVMFYNYFQTRISGFGTRADQFGTELLNAISRQLDKGA